MYSPKSVIFRVLFLKSSWSSILSLINTEKENQRHLVTIFQKSLLFFQYFFKQNCSIRITEMNKSVEYGNSIVQITSFDRWQHGHSCLVYYVIEFMELCHVVWTCFDHNSFDFSIKTCLAYHELIIFWSEIKCFCQFRDSEIRKSISLWPRVCSFGCKKCFQNSRNYSENQKCSFNNWMVWCLATPIGIAWFFEKKPTE